MTVRAWAGIALAMLFLSAGLFASLSYPFAPAAVSLAFFAWTALCRWRPLAAMAAILGLLPIAGLASWTGWLIVEELDWLLAGFAAAGYSVGLALPASLVAPPTPIASRFGWWRPTGAPGPAGTFLLLAFGASCAIALIRGYPAAQGPPVQWTQGYFDPLNSARLFKPFAWTLVLLPLLARHYRHSASAFCDALGHGMLGGLALCSLTVLWERTAFPGLLNFSSDYRTTGLFWEMHVGGAALDGYLLLAMPFAIRAVMQARGSVALALSAIVTLLGLYACLTTFSRGVYLALPVALAIMALLTLRSSAQSPAAPIGTICLRASLALVGTAAGTWLVFEHGGYRATGAALSVLGGVILSGPCARVLGPVRTAACLLAGLMGGLAADLGAALLPKGPYLLHGLALAGFAIAWGAQAARPHAGAAAGMLIAVGWMTVTAARIAYHWGAAPALWGAALVLPILPLLSVMGAALHADIWPKQRRSQLMALGALLMTSACVAVFAGGAYMGGRFSTSTQDLAGRLRHWQDGAGLIQSPVAWLLGNGYGRFPAAYFFHLDPRERPGTYAWQAQADDGYLALSAPGFPLSWGDYFRVSQRIPAAPGPYRVTLTARAQRKLVVHVEVCEKHLLYAIHCATREMAVKAGSAGWQRQSVTLEGSSLTGGAWFAPRLAMFSIAVATPGTRVDIDELRLEAPDGSQLIHNPSFAQGTAGWFFTSDRHHLPWHIKNLPMNLLFDQGLVGLTGFGLLVATALGRLGLGRARGHPLAASMAGAIAGFLTVGLFDSLLDVPRVSWVFFLLVASALLIEQPFLDRSPARIT